MSGMSGPLEAMMAQVNTLGAQPASAYHEIKRGDAVLVTDSRPYRVGHVVGLASRYKGMPDYVCVDYGVQTGFWSRLFGYDKRYEWLYVGSVSLIIEEEEKEKANEHNQ